MISIITKILGFSRRNEMIAKLQSEREITQREVSLIMRRVAHCKLGQVA